MSNVTSINDPGNTPIERTVDWIAEKTGRGYLKSNTGRFYQTALKQLASVLEPDEPRDVLTVLRELEQIAARWSHKNPGNDGETARNYLQKARRALEWHRDFLLDPVGFRFDVATRDRKSAASGAADAEQNKNKRSSAAGSSPTPPLPPAAGAPACGAPPAPAVASHAYRYRLGHGREISFDLPDEFTTQEAFRFALHVVTHAVDFNPLDPEHVALVRNTLVRA